jgi:hypothetical protein
MNPRTYRKDWELVAKYPESANRHFLVLIIVGGFQPATLKDVLSIKMLTSIHDTACIVDTICLLLILYGSHACYVRV